MGLMSRLLGRSPAADGRDDRAAVLKLAKPGAVCGEIGSWKGDFAAQIYATIMPSRLHLIDPWRFDPSPAVAGRWYAGGQAKSQADMDAIHRNVCVRFKNAPEVSIHRELSTVAAGEFAEGYFDWLYIDGDHSHDAVLADLRCWYPKVKRGGQIVCDDYLWEDKNAGGRLSVMAAVQDFLEEQPVGRSYARHTQFIIEV